MKYEEPRQYKKEEVEKAILNDSVDDLIKMVISVSMSPDYDGWAESICLKLSSHHDFNVRENSILGFGHIARVTGVLKEKNIKHIIENAMCEENEYVRGQAHAAADDVSHFLGWEIKGNE